MKGEAKRFPPIIQYPKGHLLSSVILTILSYFQCKSIVILPPSPVDVFSYGDQIGDTHMEI